MATLERGSAIGEYRISALADSGSTGAIFRAEQPSVNRMVALQTSSAAPDSDVANRFLEAARRLAPVDDPHVLGVYDAGVHGGQAYAVLREPPGRTLADVLAAEGPLAARRVVRIGEQLAAAFEALDRAGLSVQAVSSSAVYLSGDGDDEHAYLAPLADLIDPARGSGPQIERAPEQSAAALAGVLSSAIGEADDDLSSGLRQSLIDDAGVFAAPSEVASAARAALPPARPRPRGLRVALAALVLAAVVAAVILVALRGGGGSTKARGVLEPVARVGAVIPLGGSPRSLAVGHGAAWVATADGSVDRVDVRTDEVVGAPIKFSRPDAHSNLTVRVGAGYVWALDGSAGLVARIDPRRSAVTARLKLGGSLDGATVGDGQLWVTRSSPDGVEPPYNELVRIDPVRMKVVRRFPVGPGPQALVVRDGVAWVTNALDGTISRIDVRTGSVRSVRVAAQPIGSALRGSTLWIPDFWGDSVIPLAASFRVPTSVVRGMHHPYSVATTPAAIWVAALTGPSPSAPTVLERIDPATRRLVGKPVQLGAKIGWIAAGDGSVWVQNQAANTLVRYRPSPKGGLVARPSPPQSRVIAPGPLSPGAWTDAGVVAPFHLVVDRTGWLVFANTQHDVQIGRFEAPLTAVELAIPTQVFTSSGGVRQPAGAAQILRILRANPHLVVRDLPDATISGVRARRALLTAKPFKGYPTFCVRPCVPTFGMPNVTTAVDTGIVERISILTWSSRTVVVIEQTARSGGSLVTTAPLVRSFRFTG